MGEKGQGLFQTTKALSRKEKKGEMTRERILGKMRIGECRNLLGGGEGIPGKNQEQL